MNTEMTNVVTDTPKVVGENIKRIRNGHKMVQAVVATKLTEMGRPTSHQKISELEAGEREATATDILMLAYVFDVSPLSLLLPRNGSRADEIEFFNVGEDEDTFIADAINVWHWAIADGPLRGAAWAKHWAKLPLDKKDKNDYRKYEERSFPKWLRDNFKGEPREKPCYACLPEETD